MTTDQEFDVIIVGGSYSGLAAAMSLGRALRKVLIIDSGNPCNKQTPHSHNFLTRDGERPDEIAAIARRQVMSYDLIKLYNGTAITAEKNGIGFKVMTSNHDTFAAKKLVFATGVRDTMPAISGFTECWGISVLHCPYCHGYEVRNKPTGILANGETALELAILIANWTKDLTLFSNGISTLSGEQQSILRKKNVGIIEKEIELLDHTGGYIQNIRFKDGTTFPVQAMYARLGFEQHCAIPNTLGCELTEEGYITTDVFQKTTVPGVFACGDNTTRMRTIATSVAMGTIAGIVANKDIVFEAVSA
jgi:thioredoxin reductase